MPTPLQFMERVLPWPGPSGSGWGNLHWHLTTKDKKKLWRGQPFKTADELITRAQGLATGTLDKAADVFFCLSQQSTTETIKFKDREFVVASRHARTATFLKAIWLDVDVKDPPQGYSTQREAWDAVQQFVQDAKLPQPSAVVWSGGGMHVYWISAVPLTVKEWEPFAQGLKLEAQRCGLRCDYGVTTDAARILRVPGTFNHKIPGTPRPVKVAGLGPDYSFAIDLAHLKVLGEPHVTAAVTKNEPFDLSAFEGYDLSKVSPEGAALAAKLNVQTDSLADGIEQRSDLPLDPTKMIKACPHFEEAARSGGRHHGQGLWNLTVLASTWLAAGRTFAHMFSNKYPTYTVEETDAMYDRKVEERASAKLGWPSCKSFENEGCKHCKTCPFQALGKSPLNLAERLQPPAPDLTTQVVTNPLTNAVITAEDLLLPDGYALDGGFICKKFIDKDDPGSPPEYVKMFDCEIITKPRVGAQRPPTLYFQYKHGDNYGDVAIKSSEMNSDQSLQTVLLDAGVYTNHEMDRYVRPFMRSWISKIDNAFKRLQSAPLGWVVEDGLRSGFAYGGTLYKADGTEEETGYAKDEFFSIFMPTGRIDPFIKAMEILSEQNHPHLEIIALQAWASPLVHFAGLKSTSALWAFSTQAGTHKSTAFRTGMALWAAPDGARDRGGVTVTGLENKMDKLRNLPAIVDELTDHDAISDIRMIFNRAQEGGQGTRATRSGGVRQRRSWQLILACGSNCSMYEFQDKKGVQTDAKAIRIFELEVPKKDGKRNRTEVDQLIGSLEHNYGHMGRVYAKYLAMHDIQIDNAYRKLADQVEIDLAMGGDGRIGDQERFWKATVVLTLLAAQVANTVMQKDYFHYDAIKTVLYDTFHKNRAHVTKHVDVAGSAAHTDETWAGLIRRWINNQLVTDVLGSGGSNPRPVEIKAQPPHDRGYPVLMHWVQNPPMVRIAYKPMIDALKEMNLGITAAEKLQHDFGGSVDRKTFLAGIPINETKTRMKVWEVPIDEDHPLFEEWVGKFPLPANSTSEAMQAQDKAYGGPSGGMGAAIQQAAKDAAVVAGATGA